MQTILEKTWDLDAAAVDEISEQMEETLSQYPYVTKRDILRLRLSAEEILLRWMEKNANLQVTLSVEKKGRWMDLSLQLDGITYRMDPLGKDGTMGGGFADNLIATLGIGWIYQYEHGENSVYISVEVENSRQVQKVFAAMLLAIVASALLRLLPEVLRGKIQTYAVTSMVEVGSRFLTMMVSPMMLFAVIDGVLSAGSPKSLDRVGRYACTRYLVSTILILLSAGLVCMFFFPFDWSVGHERGFGRFFQFLTDLVPENIIAPFADCNMMQIVFLGAILGVAMLFLQRQVQMTKRIVEEGNAIICRILSGFEKVLPVFTFLSMTDACMTLNLSSLWNYLKMALLFLAFLVIVTGVQFAWVVWREKIPWKKLWKILKPTFLIQLASASSSVAFGEAYEACERGLGIEKKLVGFALPIGTVMHKPLIAAEFVFFIAAAKGATGGSLDLSSLLILLILAFLLSVAYPPVSGGEITCYTMLLMQMGLSSGLLAFACTLSSLFDIPEASGNTLCTELQLFLTAKKHGMTEQNNGRR